MLRKTSVIAAAVAAAIVLPVHAQEEESVLALDEIVVTAQKREQNIQDVGITVTAFSGSQVQELGFTKTTDIVAMTPGLNYTVPNAESS